MNTSKVTNSSSTWRRRLSLSKINSRPANCSSENATLDTNQQTTSGSNQQLRQSSFNWDQIPLCLQYKYKLLYPSTLRLVLQRLLLLAIIKNVRASPPDLEARLLHFHLPWNLPGLVTDLDLKQWPNVKHLDRFRLAPVHLLRRDASEIRVYQAWAWLKIWSLYIWMSTKIGWITHGTESELLNRGNRQSCVAGPQIHVINSWAG